MLWRKKWNRARGNQSDWGGGGYNLVRTGITEKPMFEPRLKGGRERAMEISRRRAFQWQEQLIPS